MLLPIYGVTHVHDVQLEATIMDISATFVLCHVDKWYNASEGLGDN